MVKEGMEAEGIKIPLNFDDLITETKEESYGKVAYLDSVRLEKAISSGRLTEETVTKKNRRMTIGEQLERVESELEQIKLSSPSREDFIRSEREKRKLLAMRAARNGYIVSEDNLNFELRSTNHEQLANDFTDWLMEHNASVEHGKNLFTADEIRKFLKKYMDDMTDEELERGLHVELSLDYPNLNHAMRVEFVHKEEDGVVLVGHFYHHAHKKTDKVSCPADLLSILKVMNYFKHKGYKAQVRLAMSPAPENGDEIYYVAR